MRFLSVVVLGVGLSAYTLNAQPSAERSNPLLGDSALKLSQVGQSRVPVFSSVDGYVCFFLNAEVIRPAKRKVGVFSVPKHGLAVAEMSLDVRHVSATGEDWQQILELVAPLRQMDLTGELRVLLPDESSREYLAARMPLVYRNQIYVPLREDPKRVLILGHSSDKNEIYWELASKLKI